MINKLKEIELFKIILPLVLMALISLCGILYAQQNKKIDKKADNAVVIQMLRVVEVEQKAQKEKIQEQKKLDAEMLKTLQQLNIQMILLNEKLKEKK